MRLVGEGLKRVRDPHEVIPELEGITRGRTVSGIFKTARMSLSHLRVLILNSMVRLAFE